MAPIEGDFESTEDHNAQERDELQAQQLHEMFRY